MNAEERELQEGEGYCIRCEEITDIEQYEHYVFCSVCGKSYYD